MSVDSTKGTLHTDATCFLQIFPGKNGQGERSGRVVQGRRGHFSLDTDFAQYWNASALKKLIIFLLYLQTESVDLVFSVRNKFL